jgi:hypothetical protein
MHGDSSGRSLVACGGLDGTWEGFLPSTGDGRTQHWPIQGQGRPLRGGLCFKLLHFKD